LDFKEQCIYKTLHTEEPVPIASRVGGALPSFQSLRLVCEGGVICETCVTAV